MEISLLLLDLYAVFDTVDHANLLKFESETGIKKHALDLSELILTDKNQMPATGVQLSSEWDISY